MSSYPPIPPPTAAGSRFHKVKRTRRGPQDPYHCAAPESKELIVNLLPISVAHADFHSRTTTMLPADFQPPHFAGAASRKCNYLNISHLAIFITHSDFRPPASTMWQTGRAPTGRLFHRQATARQLPTANAGNRQCTAAGHQTQTERRQEASS